MSSSKSRAPLDPVAARTAILETIAAAAEPIPIAVLGSLPALGRKLAGTKIRELLTQDLSSGAIFPWRSAGKQALWNRDAKAFARQRLLEIAAAEVLSRNDLVNKAAASAPPLTPAAVKAAVAELIQQKRLREVPPAPNSRSKRLIDAEHPEPYLGTEIARLLEEFGLRPSPEQIRALLLQEEGQPQEDIRDVAEKMFAAMNRIAFSPGTTVTFYRLRQQPELANIPRKIFDRAALLLQTEHRALLGIHDHAAALPEKDREFFVTDGLGKYYVSIYAR